MQVETFPSWGFPCLATAAALQETTAALCLRFHMTMGEISAKAAALHDGDNKKSEPMVSCARTISFNVLVVAPLDGTLVPSNSLAIFSI